MFKKFIEEGDIPHLLLYGAQGSGKTTIATILMDKIPCQAMKLNASSSDRNVETARGKIKDFAASQPLPGRLKIVFMDEADGITPDAQRALKNTIESYAGTCRFLFTANHIHKIIPEIRSRFMQVPLRQIDKGVLVDYIEQILDYEEVQYQRQDIVDIVDRTFPDIRSTMNTIQASSITKVLKPGSGQIDISDLAEFVKLGQLGTIRQRWAGTADFLWMYKMLFDIFVPQYVQAPNRPAAALRVAEYLYRDGLVADKEINASACLMELMQIIGANVQI
jgi:DNA polymerase III delta prime subunit